LSLVAIVVIDLSGRQRLAAKRGPASRDATSGEWFHRAHVPASRQLANAQPVGAQDEIDPIFGGAAPAAELFGIAPGSDLRMATKPKWAAATITTYGHAESTLLVLGRR
jgi:hypothetical protein